LFCRLSMLWLNALIFCIYMCLSFDFAFDLDQDKDATI
jgi:hypothetical protein